MTDAMIKATYSNSCKSTLLQLMAGLYLLIALCVWPVSMAFSQNSPEVNGSADSAALEITADKTLEWLRSEQKFIARGKARARQGEVEISAETLTADYNENRGGSMEIHRMSASENVVITNDENRIYGQKAVYDLSAGKAEVTGDDLRMVSQERLITARDNFEYWSETGRIIANGEATVIQTDEKGNESSLRADQLVATLNQSENGERKLETIEGLGGIVITTPSEIITGSYGLYRASTNIATLEGGVTIRRGPNILQGEKAEVNLTSNTSKLYGSSASNGRIRGVFYPNSKDNSGGGTE